MIGEKILLYHFHQNFQIARLNQLFSNISFISVTKVIQMNHIDLTFQREMSYNTFSEEGFDICGQHDNDFFCLDSVKNIRKFKPP